MKDEQNYDACLPLHGINKDIQIIDNFLPDDYFNYLQNLMLNSDFPWFRNNLINYDGDGNRQFTHTLYKDNQVQSYLYEKFDQFIQAVNPLSVLRLKANLLPATGEIKEFGLHVDFNQICATSILYMNTNNGYTRFENGDKVASVANRFVVFPSYFAHAGTTCTDEHDRVVLNFNYIPKINLW